MIIFPDLPDVQVEEVEVAFEITLTLRTTSPMAPCPSCGTASSHIQSRYTRTLRDLPSSGRPIRLILHVRRFFCKKSTCAQKIFAERLPELCRPYAQRTNRLQEALCQLGLRVGGQAGADAGSDLGISGSRDTILRLVRLGKPSAPSEPRVIGLDDWAHKRRLRYGTLICDLEQMMSQRTIQRWIATGTIPYARRKRPRASLIDPYKSYLWKRWHQGCHKGAQLERELRAKGYKGSPHGIYRYLETLKAAKLAPSKHKSAAKPASSIQPNALLTLSASQATWLFFRKEEDLKPEEQETLRQLRQASPQLEVAYQLVDDFLHMVRERTGEQLDSWLNKVETSQLPAFQTFVAGVHKDKDAVLAGLTLPWSTGPVEGHVNRLKLIKRSMYGRAEFDLLKLRVLHQSKKSQDRKHKYKNRQGPQADRLKKARRMKNGTASQHTIPGISKVA